MGPVARRRLLALTHYLPPPPPTQNETSSGFHDEDKDRLQGIFDREFAEKKEHLIADLQRREKERRLNEERRAEELRQKRIALEEKNALQADETLQMWSSILSEGQSPLCCAP